MLCKLRSACPFLTVGGPTLLPRAKAQGPPGFAPTRRSFLRPRAYSLRSQMALRLCQSIGRAAPPPGCHLDRGFAPAVPSPRASPCGRKWPSGCARRFPPPLRSPRRGVSERQATWGPARRRPGRGTSAAGCPTPGSPKDPPWSGAVVAGAGAGKGVGEHASGWQALFLVILCLELHQRGIGGGRTDARFSASPARPHSIPTLWGLGLPGPGGSACRWRMRSKNILGRCLKVDWHSLYKV